MHELRFLLGEFSMPTDLSLFHVINLLEQNQCVQVCADEFRMGVVLLMQSDRLIRVVVEFPRIPTGDDGRVIRLSSLGVPFAEPFLHFPGVRAYIGALPCLLPIIRMTSPGLIKTYVGTRARGTDTLAELRRTFEELLADLFVVLRLRRFLTVPLKDDDIPAAFVNQARAFGDTELPRERTSGYSASTTPRLATYAQRF